jgi:signal transduction histidine kinase
MTIERIDDRAPTPAGEDGDEAVALAGASARAALARVGGEIARNALVATGALFVHVSAFDAESGLLHTAASAGLHLGTVQAAIAAIRRALPGWSVEKLTVRADGNPVNRAVYYDGRTVAAPLHETIEGIVDHRVAQVGITVLGIRQSLICPLIVRGRVAGAISFHTRDRPDEPRRRTCEAFARQAALALENGELLEEVRARARELRRTRQRTAATEERLRSDIAERLHGTVQNRLLIAWHRLGAARDQVREDPDAAVRILDEVREQLERLREQDVRAASHQLHPAIVRIGLLPAVRSLVRDLEGQLAIAIESDQTFQWLDDPAERRLPERLRLAVYRVVEEALANVVRHAGAGRTEIRLTAADGRAVEVVVRDDGRGFEPATAERGLGLSTVAERVDLADGTWSIQSAPGHGTTLWARFPLAGD